MKQNTNSELGIRIEKNMSAYRYSRPLILLFWAVWIIGLFLITHPYGGIRHDGILYVGQALKHINPTSFSNDVFFAHGSQDTYTVFSTPFSMLIAALGVGNAAMALLAFSLGLFITASCVLAYRLVGSQHPWSVLLLAISPTVYGGGGVFSYSENFLTARSYAEPLVLLAVAAALGQRRWLAATLFAIAMATHPLIALPGIGLWWVLESLKQPRWWWLGLVVGLAPFLALLGVSPFDALLRTYDGPWSESVIRYSSHHAFILNWRAVDWSVVAFDAVVLVLASSGQRKEVSRVATAALVVGIGGILISLVGGDFAANVLITSLQMWRAHWLMHWCAVALLPVVLLGFWQREGGGRYVCLTLFFAFFAMRGPHGYAVSMIVLLVYLARDHVRYSPTALIVSGAAMFLATFAAWHGYVAYAYELGVRAMESSIKPFAIRSLSQPLPVLTIFAGIAWLAFRRNRLKSMVGVGVLVLCFALWNWDQRNAWAHYVEGAQSAAHPFASMIGPSDQVYWYKDLASPWLVLNRSSYYVNQQGSGALFNRDTALELEKRSTVVGMLEFQQELCTLMNNLNKRADSCSPDTEAVRAMCKNAQTLEYVVLPNRLDGAREAERWRVPIKGELMFYLYRCSTLLHSDV